ncbi:MAG TPA: ClpXP protease specificity-enhancing factor SspB [Kiloniellaceae bacterium]|nr:ClpXP protease specificity-enhancing factor SspB [Kiloniellaceae bacterium]
MADSELQYDVFVEDALRSVVQRSIAYVAEHGLPGEHHLYITFRTDHPDVEMSDDLRQRYASEMTIVLQHQFWDLQSGDEGFSVTLSFGSIPQHLSVPYDAVIAFADPSVRFGLQFDVVGEEEDATDEDRGAEEPGATKEAPAVNGETNVITLDTFRKKD